MKIRNGFVSNSSSSSFVVVGVRAKSADIIKALGSEDMFQEMVDEEYRNGMMIWDSESTGSYVYYGAFNIHDDEEWEVKKVKSFDKFMKRTNPEESIKDEASGFFKVPKSKLEFGLWSGRMAT